MRAVNNSERITDSPGLLKQLIENSMVGLLVAAVQVEVKYLNPCRARMPGYRPTLQRVVGLSAARLARTRVKTEVVMGHIEALGLLMEEDDAGSRVVGVCPVPHRLDRGHLPSKRNAGNCHRDGGESWANWTRSSESVQ
jgi:hypothetical protein